MRARKLLAKRPQDAREKHEVAHLVQPDEEDGANPLAIYGSGAPRPPGE
jgi:hypothetical protein